MRVGSIVIVLAWGLGGCFRSASLGEADAGEGPPDAASDLGPDGGAMDFAADQAPIDMDPDRPDLAAPPPAPTLRAPALGAFTGSLHGPREGADAPLRPWLSWGPVAAATGYRVQLAACAEGPWTSCRFDAPALEVEVRGERAPSGDALRFRPDDALPVAAEPPVGRRYVWRVASCNAAGCGSFGSARYLFVGRDRHDLDGDGYGELVVSSLGRRDVVPSAPGEVFLYRGSATGPGDSPEWTLQSPNPATNGFFGWSMAAAGDVDGDGFGDLVIGARTEETDEVVTGRAYLFRGGPMGPVAPPLALEPPAGVAPGSFGEVAGPGDLDGDGFADVVVLALGGRAYVYGGGRDVPTEPSASISRPVLDDPLTSFPNEVGSPGDVDGDGYPDLLVAGVRSERVGSVRGTRVVGMVFPGGSAGVAASPSAFFEESDGSGSAPRRIQQVTLTGADCDRDGYADVLFGVAGTEGVVDAGSFRLFRGSGAGLVGTPAQEVERPRGAAGFFAGSLSTPADLDGDGRPDVGVSSSGQAFLYVGGAAGFASMPIGFPTPPGTLGRHGEVVATVDVNGDGLSDLVVGAPEADGRAHVYLGTPSGPRRTPSQTLTNPDLDRFGFGFGLAFAD